MHRNFWATEALLLFNNLAYCGLAAAPDDMVAGLISTNLPSHSPKSSVTVGGQTVGIAPEMCDYHQKVQVTWNSPVAWPATDNILTSTSLSNETFYNGFFQEIVYTKTNIPTAATREITVPSPVAGIAALALLGGIGIARKLRQWR